MSTRLSAITGATGLLGSHIAEILRQRGERVRALVRPTADTSFLREIGVELSEGDLHQPETLPRFAEGADVVYHCAARVGDWGTWPLFEREVVHGTRNILDACQKVGIGRFLHVSSIIVYGHPKERAELFTEDEPLGQRPWLWDHYLRAKVAAEGLCRQYPGPLSIVRPSWTYGPRDRTTLPRVLKALEGGRVAIVGKGDNRLNIVYAGDVAEGAILAATNPRAVGEAYNLASSGEITQREFLQHFTAALGIPMVRRSVPFRLAWAGALVSEVVARLLFLKRPPHLTRYGVALIGRSVRFSTAKAREQLGWQPKVGVMEGVRKTLEWHFRQSGVCSPESGGRETLRLAPDSSRLSL